MDGVMDIIRMQILSNQNQLVKDGKIAWKTLLLLYLFSYHKTVFEYVKGVIKSFFENLTIYKKYIQFERTPKGIVYMKMENTNDIFKEMMSRHSLDFGSISMKNSNEYYAKNSKTIIITDEIYFEIYYGTQQIITESTTTTTTTKKEEKKPISQEDYETIENCRGRVYSYSKTITEIVKYLKSTYQPIAEKTDEITEKEKKETPNLSTLSVVRLIEIDKNDILKGERQDFTISKNMHNIFLETRIHEKLNSHFERFNDKFWYASRGIPRTLGVLLHGQPGCGKTSFIKAICATEERTAVIIDFKLIRNVRHLRSIFQGSMELKNGSSFGFNKNKIVYVFEDFDCMSDIFMDREKKEKIDMKKKELEEKAIRAYINYNKRSRKREDEEEFDDNETKVNSDSDQEQFCERETLLEKARKKWEGITDSVPLTLNDFLEIMDGIIEMDGRIIVMTTNCKDKIDKALLRPGRIDIDLELQPPSLELICEIFFYMYQNEDDDDISKIWKKYENYCKGSVLSTAKVMNCFMYINPEIGLQEFIKTCGGSIGSMESISENIQEEKHDVVTIAKKRVMERKERVLYLIESEEDFLYNYLQEHSNISVELTHLFNTSTKQTRCSYSDTKTLLMSNISTTTVSIQNSWNCWSSTYEFIYTFYKFTFAPTLLLSKSVYYVPKSWILYGKYNNDWIFIAESVVTNNDDFIKHSINNSKYFTALKFAIPKTMCMGKETAYVNIQLQQLCFKGCIKIDETK